MNTPMKNKLMMGGTLLLLAAIPAVAQDETNTNQKSIYRANELSVDGFGSASLGKYTIDHLSGDRVYNNTRLGGGLGLDYFITRYIGLDAEAYTENGSPTFVDSASANLLLRLPLGQSGFAPYALGGAGYRFDNVKAAFGEFGAGIEYRFTPNWGVFVDAREVVPTETTTYGLARAGLKFSF